MITRQHAIFPTSNHAPIRNLLIVLANISFLILNKGRKEGYYTIRKDKWKLRLLSNETYTQKKKTRTNTEESEYKKRNVRINS